MRAGAPEKLLPWDSVLALIPLSQRCIQRWITEQKFPRPLKLGSRSFFVESEISAFIDAVKGQRKATQ
jgi:predicted DNA-binding transcriptional regulator AlpA